MSETSIDQDLLYKFSVRCPELMNLLNCPSRPVKNSHVFQLLKACGASKMKPNKLEAAELVKYLLVQRDQPLSHCLTLKRIQSIITRLKVKTHRLNRNKRQQFMDSEFQIDAPRPPSEWASTSTSTVSRTSSRKEFLDMKEELFELKQKNEEQLEEKAKAEKTVTVALRNVRQIRYKYSKLLNEKLAIQQKLGDDVDFWEEMAILKEKVGRLERENKELRQRNSVLEAQLTKGAFTRQEMSLETSPGVSPGASSEGARVGFSLQKSAPAVSECVSGDSGDVSGVLPHESTLTETT